MTDHTAYDRLMAEAIPTGRFGGPHEHTPGATTPASLAALHYAELEAELAAYEIGRGARNVRRKRHLTVVTDSAAA